MFLLLITAGFLVGVVIVLWIDVGQLADHVSVERAARRDAENDARKAKAETDALLDHMNDQGEDDDGEPDAGAE